MPLVSLVTIAEDVQCSRVKLGLGQEQLACKAGVSSRFIRNLGKKQRFTRELKYLKMLLSLLVTLELYNHEQEVRAIMQGMTQVGNKQRIKVDRRKFGRVYSRRGRR